MDPQRLKSLRKLALLCEPRRAPDPLAAAYVEPGAPVSRELHDRLLALPDLPQKFLVVGGRGVGKSTELRRLATRLADSSDLYPLFIDLDASGLTVAELTAFDLVYLVCLPLVAHVRDDKQRARLVKRLADAYNRNAAEPRSALGHLVDQLKGLATFAGTVGAAGTVLLGDPGFAPAVVAGLKAAEAGGGLILRARQGRELVLENQPEGREILEVAREIRAALDLDGRQPVILVDGLERMNGEAAERFKEVFERTRLLFDLPWPMALAAPPCTVSHANGAANLGYLPVEVRGFEDDAQAADVLRKRLVAAGLPADEGLAPELRRRIAEISGGHAATAVQCLREATTLTIIAGSPVITSDAVEAGIRAVGVNLGRGLSDADFRLLHRVETASSMPDREDDAATFARHFAEGRILSIPPKPGSFAPRFRIHPLLVADARRKAAVRATAESPE